MFNLKLIKCKNCDNVLSCFFYEATIPVSYRFLMSQFEALTNQK